MKRILLAWELGGNWGHLARDLPIALALRERGYEVHFVVRDVPTAAGFLAPHAFAFEQAPLAPVARASRFAVAKNYAGVLSTQGYGNTVALHRLVTRWLEIFRTTQPVLVIADFAPGAMLAARAAGLPLATLGLGFEIPPVTHPLPPIRPWESFSLDNLVRVDTTLLEAFNTVLAQFSAAPLHRVADLFAGKWAVLSTFPELAHYGPRAEGHFVGPIYSAPPMSHEARWPDTRGPRLLAYLRPHTRGLDAILAALSSLGTLIASVPGLSSIPTSITGAPQIYTHALQLQHLLPHADLLVTNGNLTTSTRALLAGVPILAVPNYVEQHLGALRITELGAGLIAARRRSERDLSVQIRELLHGPHRTHALRFAHRYPHETVTKAITRATNLFTAAAR